MLKAPFQGTVCLQCSIRFLSAHRTSNQILHTARPLAVSAPHVASRRTRRTITDGSRRAFGTYAARKNQPVSREHDANLPEQSSLLETTASETTSSSRGDPETIARAARNLFGDSLPDGALKGEELAVYKRLYGEPASVVEEVQEEEGEGNDVLQTQSEDGQWTSLKERLGDELIEYEIVEQDEEVGIEDDAVEQEYDNEDIWKSDPDYVRTHPFTLAGRFGTNPSTVQIPKATFVEPVSALLAASSSGKQLTTAAERCFGGLGLPNSPATPAISRTMEQKPVALSARQSKMTDMDADAFLVGVYPHAYASLTSALVEIRKRLGSEWLRGLLRKPGGPLVLDAGAGGAGVLAWRDVLNAEWEAVQEEEDPATVLGESIVEGSEDIEQKPAPLGKAVVVTGSDALRHRASRLLDNTTFIPRLPDLVPGEQHEGASPRKQYDVILAPYSLWRLPQDFERKYHVQTLWSLLNAEGGILILLEKGVPRGFEAIAGARDHLLEKHIQDPNAPEEIPVGTTTATEDSPEAPEKEQKGGSKKDQKDNKPKIVWDATPKEPGMIVAPCTNHSACPLYPTPGLSRGRKDWCYFSQRYIRPPFLQNVLGARRRNHDDIEFSYVAVQRGVDLRRDDALPADREPLIQGPDATAAAFEGYGDKVVFKSKSQKRAEKQAKQHTGAMESSIFGAYEEAGRDEDDEEEVLEDTPQRPAPHPLSLPRLILPPLKRKGHIVLDVCTPSGTFERWLVSRKSGKQAYRDARKAKWGDLWALGAKSREPRRIRAGEVKKEHKNKGRKKKELKEALVDLGLIDE